MIAIAAVVDMSWPLTIAFNVLVLAGVFGCVFLGYRPFFQFIRNQERYYDIALRGKLLIDIAPRTASYLFGALAVVLTFIGYAATGSMVGVFLGIAAGVLSPYLVIRYLRRRRLGKLESQLVGGVQTLASGVRAGLNMVQAMQLIARDGPAPIRQEFAHLLREYEYGIPLDEAMSNAAARIGSSDYRLLFAALHTHRQRGGDLGETLDRISASIREIQRLEKRVESLTAQGRATARWLGALPFVVLLILYFLVDSTGVEALLRDDVGKMILAVIVVLNIAGFVWIRKIVSIDI